MAAPLTPLRLLVGLGNPGSEYARTRHNAGFRFLERLLEQKRLSLRRESRFHGALAKLVHDEGETWLLQPDTFMNRSGDAVAAVVRFHRLEPGSVLIVHDELDLPPGTVRLKRGGGHGGHNGLRDIIPKLGSPDFLRLRIGIGHPGAPERVVGHVLGRPPAADEAAIDAAIEQALLCLPTLLAGDHARVMNELNRPPAAPR